MQHALVCKKGQIFVPNKFSNSRVNISVRGFWQTGQLTFYDVKVFYSNTKWYKNVRTRKYYKIKEKENKKSYNKRIINIDHGIFTPLVMIANGGMGRGSQTFYAKLSEKISEKLCQPYSVVAHHGFGEKFFFLWWSQFAFTYEVAII